MPTTEIECQRDGCSETFRVGDKGTAERCPACGEKHTPPWRETSSTSTTEAVATDGGETTVEAPAGTTVRITIEIVPGETN